MKLIQSLFAILAATSALASAVSPAAERESSVEKRGPDWGQCNGTSCKVNGKNYGCTKGKVSKNYPSYPTPVLESQ